MSRYMVEVPIFLKADNQSSHCLLSAILFCGENFIPFLTLPFHASYVVQSLFKAFFVPLKAAYTVEVEK